MTPLLSSALLRVQTDERLAELAAAATSSMPTPSSSAIAWSGSMSSPKTIVWLAA